MNHRASSNWRLFYIILVSVPVIVVVILVFNSHGFFALSKLKSDVDHLSVSIDSLQRELDSLESEIDRLKSDSLYLEKMVREILGWGYSDEYIIRFVHPDSTEISF